MTCATRSRVAARDANNARGSAPDAAAASGDGKETHDDDESGIKLAVREGSREFCVSAWRVARLRRRRTRTRLRVRGDGLLEAEAVELVHAKRKVGRDAVVSCDD